MKVLFLDVDGVLNSTQRAKAGFSYETLDPRAIHWLQYIAANSVAIVVSSSWRNHYPKEELVERLRVPVFGTTPWLRGPPRGTEIAVWLGQHPSVDRYAIIDDDNDMLPVQQEHYVKTEHETGMQLQHFKALCLLLDIPIPN